MAQRSADLAGRVARCRQRARWEAGLLQGVVAPSRQAGWKQSAAVGLPLACQAAVHWGQQLAGLKAALWKQLVAVLATGQVVGW